MSIPWGDSWGESWVEGAWGENQANHMAAVTFHPEALSPGVSSSFLDPIVVPPGVMRGVRIELADYLDEDTIDEVEWSGATGLTVTGADLDDDVAACIVSPSQEGVNYNLTCAVTLDSTATEKFRIVVQCRSGAVDPRLAR